jgi:membrane protein YdbS with pleckstrin-like domain
MCLIIAFVFFIAAYNFFLNALIPHTIFATIVGLIILTFFIYRMYSNRKCIFGNKKDCNKKK